MAEIEPMPEPPIEIKEEPTIIKEAVKEPKPKKTFFDKIFEIFSDSYPYIAVIILAIVVYYFIKQGQEPEQVLATESFDST